MIFRFFLRRVELTIPVIIWRPQVVEVSTSTASQFALENRSNWPDSVLWVEALERVFIQPEAITQNPRTPIHSA